MKLPSICGEIYSRFACRQLLLLLLYVSSDY
jgi:hypothetical protein